jgi:hypothetical protein
MAQPPVRAPLYPDVPFASGVPDVLRATQGGIQRAVFTAILLQADIAAVYRIFQGPEWALVDDTGFLIVVPDTVVNVAFRREWRVADYPMERGAFESYNKVMVPYDARISMACGGQNMPRSVFLSAIDIASASLNLYTIITPDAVIPNMSIIHYDYIRAQTEGNGMVIVDIWMQEIREVVETQFSNTKEPTSQGEKNLGVVQAQTPTATQTSNIAGTSGNVGANTRIVEAGNVSGTSRFSNAGTRFT